MKYWINLIALLFFSLPTWAQESQEVEMADAMRSNGKIYVVVAVLVLIFLGLIINMIRLEKKMNRIEKDLES